MGILEFMTESPILTCFIIFIICAFALDAISAIKNKGDK